MSLSSHNFRRNFTLILALIVWITERCTSSQAQTVVVDFGAHLVINTAPVNLSGWKMANGSTANNSGNAADMADPDLNIVNEESLSRPMWVTVRGSWHLSTATGNVCAWKLPNVAVNQNVRVDSNNAAETVLEINCQHGGQLRYQPNSMIEPGYPA